MVVSGDVVCGVLDEKGSEVIIQITSVSVLADRVHREMASDHQVVRRRRRHLLLNPRPLLRRFAYSSERELGIVSRVALIPHSVS